MKGAPQGQPAQAGQPGQPVNPMAQSAQPGQPVQPGQPAQPGGPVNPMAQSAPPQGAGNQGPQRFDSGLNPNLQGTAGAAGAAPYVGPQFTPLPKVIDPSGYEKITFGELLGAGKEQGVNPSKFGLTEKSGGKKFLLKPVEGEVPIAATYGMGIPTGQAGRRVPAAEMLATDLGIRTPKSELVLYEGKICSMQEWLGDKPTLLAIRREDPQLFDKILHSQQMKDFDAFQYVVGGLDVNYGNILVDVNPATKEFQLIAIDMDASLPATTRRFTNIDDIKKLNPDFALPQAPLPGTISQDLADRLTKLSQNRGAVEAALSRYLAEPEIKGAMFRLDEAIAKINSGEIKIVK
jgi:hypothetical protein